MDDKFMQQIQEINSKLTGIGIKLDAALNWTMRFDAVENKIANLEQAVESLKEIKERVVKIETVIEEIAGSKDK